MGPKFGTNRPALGHSFAPRSFAPLLPLLCASFAPPLHCSATARRLCPFYSDIRMLENDPTPDPEIYAKLQI